MYRKIWRCSDVQTSRFHSNSMLLDEETEKSRENNTRQSLASMKSFFQSVSVKEINKQIMKYIFLESKSRLYETEIKSFVWRLRRHKLKVTYFPKKRAKKMKIAHFETQISVRNPEWKFNLSHGDKEILEIKSGLLRIFEQIISIFREREYTDIIRTLKSDLKRTVWKTLTS